MSLSHRLTRMTGRDPRESHRSATPLELLFDLLTLDESKPAEAVA